VSSTSSGVATLIIAGVMNASFTMPMKYARKWAWENTWLAWTMFALVVLPFVTALMTIPNLSMVYRSAPLDVILEVAGFGAGWGVAQVFFGVAVDMIGITLAFSVVLGTSAAVGSLIPMVSLHREHLNSAAGYAVIGAVAFVLFGVTLCAAAGRLRDRPSGLSISSKKTPRRDCCLQLCAVSPHPS
jgi:L-rhamnose-H+ transport protein